LLVHPGKAPLEQATLVIEGTRVREVADGFREPARGEQVIDLRHAFVLPGLIDCHVHLSLEYSADARLRAVEESDADAAVAATVFAERTLLAGFTTVRDLGSAGRAVFAVRDAILAGKILGPRILCAGQAITPSGGHGDDTHGYRDDIFDLPGPMQGVADGVPECRKAVRLQVKRGADVVKLTATGGVMSATNAGTGQQFFDDELEAIVQTAHMLGRRVAAHAHGADGIAGALRAGVDSIEHGSFLDEPCIELFLQTNAFLVPTLMAGESVSQWAEIDGFLPEAVREKARQVGPVMRGSLGRAARAGVRIAFGTDCGVSPHGTNAHEFELMVAAGLSPSEAIVAATVNAAELCGLSRDCGTLEPGMAADLVAVDGDPLSDVSALRKIVLVVRAGELQAPRPH
jgi:imidazolonepropionase-like amidohydrolase